MLKKNLVRNIEFSYGLLLLFIVATAMRPEPGSLEKKLPYLKWYSADTLFQPFSLDSLALQPEEIDAVPKISLNKHASKFVKGFLVKEDEALQKVKGRSTSYFKMIEGIFAKYGLPAELKYLAVVESDLKTTAVSRVGAKGMWQFMPTTARELGLKITNKYDERTHAYKSTVAAAKYLKDLHTQFGDWLLVIAAYNSGPGPIYSAIKKSGSRSFWALQYYLPEESRGHVKRFIGTHYFFEGKGSMVTLTKAETVKYIKELETFKASIQTKELIKDSVIVTAFVETK
jgi:membrane-bound lytic murein transglycosylase D